MIQCLDMRECFPRYGGMGVWAFGRKKTSHTPTFPHAHTLSGLDSKRSRFGMLRLLIALLTPIAAFAQGPQTVRVRALAERVLAERYPDDAHRLEVRVKRVEATFEAEAGLRLDFRAEDEVPRGTTQVKLFTGSDASGWQKAGWALLYIARFDSVVIARARVSSGDEVSLADANVAWIETTAFRGEPLRPDDLRARIQEGTLFATRSLGEGRVLRRDDLRPAYAVETGATVMMRYRRGRLQFELSCKARQAGYLDDAIRLYSSETGKTYRARLTGPGAAEWIETL